MATIYKPKGRKHGKWMIGYTDEKGARRTVAGAVSKTVTQQIAAKLEGDVELCKRGVFDRKTKNLYENRPICR